MSRMLNLAEHLLGQGRTQQQLGRVHDAFTILSRLSRFRELSQGVAEETQARLGEIQLKRRKYTRAHRHLLAALRYDPENARYHHLLGNALQQQGEDQWERAASHYRQAIELDPQSADSLVELGLLNVRQGNADEGIVHLRRAVEMKPHDRAILCKLVKGLRWAGRLREARSAIRIALFRNPRDSRFQQVWNDFQFRMLRRHQQRQEGARRAGTQAGPVLLPFVRLTGEKDRTPRPVAADTIVPVTLAGRATRPLDQKNVQ